MRRSIHKRKDLFGDDDMVIVNRGVKKPSLFNDYDTFVKTLKAGCNTNVSWSFGMAYNVLRLGEVRA